MAYLEVRENETLAELIRRARPGLAPATVWEHERNQHLHATRSPQLLRTGDPIWLDEDDDGDGRTWFSIKRGESRRFVADPETRPFRVVLHVPDGSKVTSQPFTLEIDGGEFSGETAADGTLEVDVPITATDGMLRVGGYAQALQIGGLEPLHTTKGIQGRLLNLGFPPGPIDGSIGPRTIAAIRAFQAAQDLKTDGVVGPKTRAALAEAHGT